MPHFEEAVSIEETANHLYERLIALRDRYAKDESHRILVAVAGVPGSGKSTIAAALSKIYFRKQQRRLAVFPMDGFHYPRSVLKTFPDPELAFRRRGAAFTFDANAFIKLVRQLRKTPITKADDPASAILAPSFDHAVKDPVENDIRISSAESIVILEGNYLFLDEQPWREISELVDEKWFVDAPEDVAKERVVKRHLAAGIESTREAAEARVESNDLLNGRLIREQRVTPDLIIQN